MEIHISTYFTTGWADTMVHSLNPFSIVHFNPMLEYFKKPNIEHNLHHILNKDYYVFNSFRHLWDIKTRDKDLKMYNDACGTNISFDLFIDDK